MDYDPFLNERELDIRSIYLDCTVYNETISVTGITDPDIWRPKPLCTTGNLAGRWLRIDDGKDCPSWACIGSAQDRMWIDDLFAFNNAYVWAPYQCIYRLYSAPQVILNMHGNFMQGVKYKNPIVVTLNLCLVDSVFNQFTLCSLDFIVVPYLMIRYSIHCR